MRAARTICPRRAQVWYMIFVRLRVSAQPLLLRCCTLRRTFLRSRRTRLRTCARGRRGGKVFDHGAIFRRPKAELPIEHDGAGVLRFDLETKAFCAQGMGKGKQFFCKAFAAEGGAQVDFVDPDREAACLARIRLLQQGVACGRVLVEKQISRKIGPLTHDFGKGVLMKLTRNGMFHGRRSIEFFGHGKKEGLVLRGKHTDHGKRIAQGRVFVNRVFEGKSAESRTKAERGKGRRRIWRGVRMGGGKYFVATC